jgi:hypothetical protein
MKPTEIIMQDAQNNGVDGTILLKHLHNQMGNHQTVLLHENKSVLSLTKIDGGVSVHLYSLDSPMILMKSLILFLKKIRNMPQVKVIYGDTKNQSILRLLGMIGLNVQPSNLPKYTWMARI